MIDLGDYYTRIILLAVSASYYHIVYGLLFKMRKIIDDWYFIIKSPISFIVFIMYIYYMNRNGSNYEGSLNVMLYYTTIIYAIIIMGDDSRYMLLGVSSAFFISEYWEIPNYIYLILHTSKYAGISLWSGVYLSGRFIIKILCGLYMLKQIDELGLQKDKLIEDFVIFSVFYIPIVFIILASHFKFYGVIGVGWIMRISCFLVLVRYLYKEEVIVL